MAPNLVDNSILTSSTTEPVKGPSHKVSQTGNQRHEFRLVWKNIILIFVLHVAAIYAFWLWYKGASWKTVLFMTMYGAICGYGVTAGTHRLWAHRTYKAKMPLRIVLMLLQTTAMQGSIYEWVRDHRVHHKFTETDADPHDVRRGFFFAHMGWILVRKHKDVINKGKTLDLSDLEADPVVTFQRKYYAIMAPVMCIVIPAIFPCYYWGEAVWPSLMASICKYVISLHCTWFVNSAAHMFGTRPYNKSIHASDNYFVAWVAAGEGWHNYHHVFPWDYKTAELGNYTLNMTKAFLDLMAKIGWAYELKTASPSLIKKYAETVGDGSWTNGKNTTFSDINFNHVHHDNAVWGWGDKDLKMEDMDSAISYSNLKKM